MPYAAKQLEITFHISLLSLKLFKIINIENLLVFAQKVHFLHWLLKSVSLLLSNEQKHLHDINPNM